MTFNFFYEFGNISISNLNYISLQKGLLDIKDIQYQKARFVAGGEAELYLDKMVSRLFPSFVYICAHDKNEHIISFFIKNKGNRALESKTFKASYSENISRLCKWKKEFKWKTTNLQ